MAEHSLNLPEYFETFPMHGYLYVELEQAFISNVADSQKGLKGVNFSWRIDLSSGHAVCVSSISEKHAEYSLLGEDDQFIVGGIVELINYDGPEHLAMDISNGIAAQTSD